MYIGQIALSLGAKGNDLDILLQQPYLLSSSATKGKSKIFYKHGGCTGDFGYVGGKVSQGQRDGGRDEGGIRIDLTVL